MMKILFLSLAVVLVALVAFATCEEDDTRMGRDGGGGGGGGGGSKQYSWLTLTK